MEPKKNPEVNLESKKGMFLQIGLSIALLIALNAFEYKSHEKVEKDETERTHKQEDEDIIPITEQEKQKPKPKPPPPPEVIIVVKDDVVIKDSVIIEIPDFDDVMDIEEEDDEEIFMVVENMPEFKCMKIKGHKKELCGVEGLMTYLAVNTKYPAIAKEYNITGRVFLSFVVEKSGAVTNVEVLRGVDKNLDAEAVRVVKSLPNFKPGKQRGIPVRCSYNVPINFILN